MKIAINDTVIDTEHIYKISKIFENIPSTFMSSSEQMYFNIYLFNTGNPITVTINIRKRLRNIWNNSFYYKNKETFDKVEYPDLNEEGMKAKEEIVSVVRKELHDFRDKILQIWSNNQSNIPKYTIE